jgi:hypothetical protein
MLRLPPGSSRCPPVSSFAILISPHLGLVSHQLMSPCFSLLHDVSIVALLFLISNVFFWPFFIPNAYHMYYATFSHPTPTLLHPRFSTSAYLVLILFLTQNLSDPCFSPNTKVLQPCFSRNAQLVTPMFLTKFLPRYAPVSRPMHTSLRPCFAPKMTTFPT